MRMALHFKIECAQRGPSCKRLVNTLTSAGDSAAFKRQMYSTAASFLSRIFITVPRSRPQR